MQEKYCQYFIFVKQEPFRHVLFSHLGRFPEYQSLLFLIDR